MTKYGSNEENNAPAPPSTFSYNGITKDEKSKIFIQTSSIQATRDDIGLAFKTTLNELSLIAKRDGSGEKSKAVAKATVQTWEAAQIQLKQKLKDCQIASQVLNNTITGIGALYDQHTDQVLKDQKLIRDNNEELHKWFSETVEKLAEVATPAYQIINNISEEIPIEQSSTENNSTNSKL